MAQPEHGNNYLPGYKPAHIRHHEWRTADNSAAYLLPTLEAMKERNPQLRLLDVGTGSGTMATSLAARIPEGQVLATDMSDEILSRARSLAESAPGKAANVTFRQANAYELDFPDESFDIVHASQMLCHLRDPVAALQQMLRVTRPGGVVAVRDADLRIWCVWPELPGLKQFHELLIETLEAAGGNSRGGRQLLSWGLAAGAARENITFSYGAWCFGTAADREMMGETMAERVRNGEMRKMALNMGLATEEQLEEMSSAWDEWIKSEEASLGLMNGELLIVKS